MRSSSGTRSSSRSSGATVTGPGSSNTRSTTFTRSSTPTAARLPAAPRSGRHGGVQPLRSGGQRAQPARLGGVGVLPLSRRSRAFGRGVRAARRARRMASPLPHLAERQLLGHRLGHGHGQPAAHADGRAHLVRSRTPHVGRYEPASRAQQPPAHSHRRGARARGGSAGVRGRERRARALGQPAPVGRRHRFLS